MSDIDLSPSELIPDSREYVCGECEREVEEGDVCDDCGESYCRNCLVTMHPDMAKIIYVAKLAATGRGMPNRIAPFDPQRLCRVCWAKWLEIDICRTCKTADSIAWFDPDFAKWHCEQCGEYDDHPEALEETHPNVFEYFKESGMEMYVAAAIRLGGVE